ncbi:hypothetical protein CNMCM5623_008699 [Aspergillus felis]|uniref:Carrier domain-containing protein n=1 Tax=Aspergillus felis TaxID=1287682 RepID=A0A8H6UL63_9EURO|nr:hypothetical protein CNMCM5623_008699 [Aspergillus felis]
MLKISLCYGCGLRVEISGLETAPDRNENQMLADPQWLPPGNRLSPRTHTLLIMEQVLRIHSRLDLFQPAPSRNCTVVFDTSGCGGVHQQPIQYHGCWRPICCERGRRLGRRRWCICSPPKGRRRLALLSHGPIANVYVEALEEMQSTGIDSALETVTFSSPVTGGRMTDAKEIASPEHWVQSLLQPVQFIDAFIDMIVRESLTSASNVDVVVEVGPHTALGGPIQEILALPEFKDLRILYYGCLVRKTDARQSMQALAASLLQEGYPVDTEAVNFPHGREQHVKVLTELPSYPWNHQVKHWVEPRFNRALRERSHQPPDLLGSLVEGSNPETPSILGCSGSCCSKISHTAGHIFKTRSSLIRDDRQGMEADVSVVDPSDGNVVLEMKGFSYQSLGRSVLLQQAAPWETELCSKMDWSLDISIASPATFASVKEQLSCNIDPSEDSFRMDVWRVCIYLMQQALPELDPRDTEHMESHYVKYYAWMNDTVKQAASGRICIGSAEWLLDEEPERQRRIDQVAKAGVDGEMVCRLGAQLVPILRGQTAPLDLMTEDNLPSKLYTETPKVKRMGSQLAGLLRHLAHKNPRARILEIGAGTGAMTRYAFDALGTTTSGGPHASLYHYTDISAAFFEAARESLSAWSDLLSFDVLDVDQDPAAQGFTSGPYDIVIASRVLHATKSISRTLNNVRSLLKPNGTLLLMEDVQCQIDTQFVNGLLPNRWLSEEPEREANPLLSAPMWDRHLRAAGFAVDLKLPDGESTESQTAITFMATVPMPLPLKLSVGPEKLAIVTSRRAGSPPSGWLQSLQDSIAACTEGEQRKLPIVHELESASATSTWFADKICIFIGEVDEPILYDLDSASLEGIRTMSTSCKGLVWVTRGGAVDCERPKLSLAAGFVRSLRSEYVGRKLLTLDLDPKGPLWSEAGASAIVQVLRTAFSDSDGQAAEKGPTEFEYAERDGVILVPRLYHDMARDQMLSPNASDLDVKQTVVMEPFYQPDRPLCLQPESLAFGDDDKAYSDSLQPSLIEVEPRAFGTDLRHTDEHIIGLECAGIVTRVGSEAAAQGYVVGDRVVCLLSQSSFPSRATVWWRSTVRMPAELTFEEAASLPVAFLTAYFSLVAVARLQRTQSVLIHAAAGSIGQAAIMLAQHLGAEIFATVGSPGERELIMQRHGIPADHIFNSYDTSFGAATLAATNGYGVDVVLNSLTGPLLQESFNLVASLGHFVEIGKHDSERNSNLEMRPFARSITFSSVDLPSLLERRGADVHRCLGEVMRLVEAKAVAPVHPITAYSMGDIAEASRLLQTEHHIGKVVLSVGSHEMVPVVPRAVAAKLSPDASYLIVGGTGGLGQSVAHWMISRGARNLVLLSRSAARGEKTAALAEELREAGCSRVLPVSCDVANEDDVARAIQVCAQEGLPPIRGVIHAAFVLHDSFVEKMTLDDYRYTTQSKVAGCWNLHNQFNLPGDLDFFVLFSSINGILGYASQAAYSAAGAYEDALAHWRVKQCGLPAVSIDLTVVNAVGYVAEANASETLRKSLLKAGRRVIDEDHVLTSLESAILSPYDPQFVVGGINSGPGPHWELDGDLGRDMRVLPLRYRQPSAAAQEEQGQQNGSDPLAARMAACASRDEAIRAVGSALAEMLADMFLVPVEDIDLSESPSQQGVDSLVAVEVRNMLFSQAGAELSIFNIMQSPSLDMLAADVVDRSKHVKFAAAS